MPAPIVDSAARSLRSWESLTLYGSAPLVWPPKLTVNVPPDAVIVRFSR